MTDKKKDDGKGGGGFFTDFIDQVQERTGVHVFEIDEGDDGASSSGAVPPSVSPKSTPAISSPVNPVETPLPTPLPTPTVLQAQPDPSIRKQIDSLLRQAQTPGVIAVVRFESEFNKFGMISNESERRSAALTICGVTIKDLLDGYQSMLDQLVNERENDKKFVAGKIDEMIKSNDSERQRLTQEIQKNEDEIRRLNATNGSLNQQLSSLDSRVSSDRHRYERGGAVFQVTADMAEQDLNKILSDLKK